MWRVGQGGTAGAQAYPELRRLNQCARTFIFIRICANGVCIFLTFQLFTIHPSGILGRCPGAWRKCP
eukprot:8068239-Alexandrium_andersonii.AAC.1